MPYFLRCSLQNDYYFTLVSTLKGLPDCWEFIFIYHHISKIFAKSNHHTNVRTKFTSNAYYSFMVRLKATFVWYQRFWTKFKFLPVNVKWNSNGFLKCAEIYFDVMYESFWIVNKNNNGGNLTPDWTWKCHERQQSNFFPSVFIFDTVKIKYGVAILKFL